MTPAQNHMSKSEQNFILIHIVDAVWPAALQGLFFVLRFCGDILSTQYLTCSIYFSQFGEMEFWLDGHANIWSGWILFAKVLLLKTVLVHSCFSVFHWVFTGVMVLDF